MKKCSHCHKEYSGVHVCIGKEDMNDEARLEEIRNWITGTGKSLDVPLGDVEYLLKVIMDQKAELQRWFEIDIKQRGQIRELEEKVREAMKNNGKLAVANVDYQEKIVALEAEIAKLRAACEELCSQAFVDKERTRFIIPPAFEKSVRLAKSALHPAGPESPKGYCKEPNCDGH